MDCLWIEGGQKIEGKLQVPSSKNAALPLICLSLLTDQQVTLKNIPEVADIQSLTNLLAVLGVKREEDRFICPSIASDRAPYDLVRKLRASILLLGPLIARHGRAEISLPGGCAIGERPVDIHLKGLKALGAKLEISNGYIIAEAKKLKGTEFVLDFPTVTGTINLVTAACLAEGQTVLENVAREPEIVNVCQALQKMGAKIEGQGSSRIMIEGVSSLGALEWTVPADRIQLLTYLAAAAMTEGSIECFPYQKGMMNAVVQKFEEMGCQVNETADSISLIGAAELQPIEIETAPFPGFPTDAQAQFMACATIAKGTSSISENVFENRFQHVSELRRLGADIELRDHTAVVKGKAQLSGASVMASDLRASASLVLAGLRANGKTQVLRVYHLDRGYESFEQNLSKLGAKIWRETA